MSLLREYLLNGGSIEELADKYAVKHRRHCKYDNLVLFTYDIGCKFDLPFLLECRGIILDQSNDWKVVSKAFSKFFNLGESRAANIDWNTARVVQKLDGSLQSLYQYNGHWNFATSGTPDGNVPVGDFPYTFEQLAIETLQENNLWPIPDIVEGVTLICELCTEFNRIVVPHKGKKIYLLETYDCQTDTYLGNELHEFEKWPKPQQYNLNNIDDLLASFEHLDGLNNEGYVIIDSNNNRVKAKHPRYVELHHSLSGTNLKSLVAIALKGEVPETLAYFPHLTETLTNIQQRLKNKIYYLDGHYKFIKNLSTRKEFALSLVDNPYRAIFFKMKDKNISSLEVLQQERIENVINYLGLKG